MDWQDWQLSVHFYKKFHFFSTKNSTEFPRNFAVYFEKFSNILGNIPLLIISLVNFIDSYSSIDIYQFIIFEDLICLEVHK